MMRENEKRFETTDQSASVGIGIIIIIIIIITIAVDETLPVIGGNTARHLMTIIIIHSSKAR